MNHKRLRIDFDHTLARTIRYPMMVKVTPLNRLIHAYVRYKKRHGWTIILDTLREGFALLIAKRFCYMYDIPIDYYNENTVESIDEWGENPRKIACEQSLDDTQIGFIGWLLRRFA